MAIRNYEEKPQPARSRGAGSSDKKLVDLIKGWKSDSQGLVGTWENNQNKWHKLRMRVKKTKTFPFPGCSNIRIPTLDIKIRKIKANLYNAIFGIRPVVQVIPTPQGKWETASKIEKFLDHLIMNVMRINNKAIILIDQALEKGFYLAKPYWRTEITTRIEKMSLDDITIDEAMWLFSSVRTPEEIAQKLAERFDVDHHPLVGNDNRTALLDAAEETMSGKADISITVQDVIYNFPDIALASPERVYVPTTTGFDPQGAGYIVHEFYEPLTMVRQNVHNKGWDKKALKKLEKEKSSDIKDKTTDMTKDQREGIERIQKTSELVRLYEAYCWYDINGDGVKEKCVITMAPDFDVVFRKITVPFYSGKFPFIKFFYELTDDRWFSHRGLPELLEDIVKEIDIQHMQKIDSQTMRNAPMFLYRAGQVNPNVIQFTFGQGIGVPGMQPLDDMIKPFSATNTNAEFSYEREQQMLETKIEEMTGTVDFTLQSMINKREPRTASEVNLQQQTANLVFSLDATLVRTAFEDLFNWCWELWCQYGDDEYEFRYFGKGTGGEGENIKLTKEEAQGKYKITVRGNDQNTNPQVRVQKAQTILQGMNNPVAMQTGIINPVNLYNGYKRFYQELDVPNWEELITDPKEAMQQMAQQQKAAAEQKNLDNIKTKFSDLAPGEQAQVLIKMGFKPDVVGRLLGKEQDLAKEAGSGRVQGGANK